MSDETSSSRSTTRVIIPATAAAGQLILTQPPASVTSYYKIAPSNTVTFGWSFTYILATPTSLQVSASCDNGKFYPIGPTDGIIPGTATEVVWDPHAWQTENPTNPLPQGVCQLMIADTAPNRGFGSRQRGGYLTPNTGLQFALYTPQAYTPLADGWKCLTCSSASSLVSHPATISLLVTIMICFFSGFSLLRTRRG